MNSRSFNPPPWKLDGDTIRDREGGVVVSAMNPASMATRRLIVEAVNGKDEAEAPAPPSRSRIVESRRAFTAAHKDEINARQRANYAARKAAKLRSMDND